MSVQFFYLDTLAHPLKEVPLGWSGLRRTSPSLESPCRRMAGFADYWVPALGLFCWKTGV